MCEAVKVLAATCLIPSDGHEKVLEAITMYAESNNESRFAPVVNALTMRKHESLRVRVLDLYAICYLFNYWSMNFISFYFVFTLCIVILYVFICYLKFFQCINPIIFCYSKPFFISYYKS